MGVFFANWVRAGTGQTEAPSALQSLKKGTLVLFNFS